MRARSRGRTTSPGAPGSTRSWQARLAVAAIADGGHTAAAPVEFRRLVSPDAEDREAAALLRHPDLLAPVAALHRTALHERLDPGRALIA
jgi:hypothetical protein